MIDLLLRNLTSEWRDSLYAAGLDLHPPFSIIQLAGLRGIDRKVNFLVFDRMHKSPQLILKIARSRQHQEKLRQEYRCLQQVARFASLKGSVPRSIGLFEVAGHVVAGETFLPGLPLALLLRRQKHIRSREVGQDLNRAQSWLLSLQDEGVSGILQWNGESLETLMFECREFSADFKNDLQTESKTFDGASIPATASHGDFWPGNFLIDRDRTGVIDWEGFRINASPLRDNFLFITTYARSYPWLGWKWMRKGDAFRKAFLEQNWFSQQIQSYFRRYFNHLRLPISAAHLLFSEFLFLMAKEERARQTDHVPQWEEYLHLYAEDAKRSVLRSMS